MRDVARRLDRDVRARQVAGQIARGDESIERGSFVMEAASTIVEDGPAKQVIDSPREAATQAFLSHFHRQRDA